MKVYISGKIAGLSEEEFRHNFGIAEAMLHANGHEPVNPLKVAACKSEDCNGNGEPRLSDGSYLHSWACYIRYDLIAMLEECDAILMLDNWTDSRGAPFEKEVAEKCGLKVFYSLEEVLRNA